MLTTYKATRNVDPRTATLVYFGGEDLPWAIGYNHRELLVPCRFRRSEHAQQYAEIFCRNQCIRFIP